MGILFTLAWRNLWRRPGRTVLTASGAMLGLAFLLVMLGLGDGSHLQMIDTAVRMGSGHVLVQAPGYERRRGVELVLPEATLARVLAWAGSRGDRVRAALPRAFASGLLSSADGATGVVLTGIDPAAEAPVSRFPGRIVRGRFLRPGDAGGAVIGRGVARLLKAEVGGRVVAMAQGAESGEVRSALLRVVGVVDTGLEELDEGLVLTPLATLRGLLELGGAGHQVALILGDQAQSARVAAAARAAFPGLDVLTWAEADPQLAAAIRIDDGGHYLFNGIFFVIIAFMVLNTLLMSVLERRREFALLGALGLSPGRRLAIVLVEALLVALMAVAAGLAIGLGIHTYFRIHGLPLAWLTRESLETGGIVLDPVLRSVLSRGRIVGSATVVLALALLLGLVAGRRAAGPVDANLLKSR